MKGPELLSPYVGVAEANIRNLFKTARERHIHTRQATVIFIDEAESILSRRGSGISSDMEKTIVPTFLTEMDGLVDSSAFVILATNRPDTLDSAVIRDGRIDRRIAVERPSAIHGREIFLIHLNGVPIANNLTIDDLADAGTRALFVNESHANFISGAMITAAVERAKRKAIHRDTTSRQVTGLTIEDLELAISDIKGEYNVVSG